MYLSKLLFAYRGDFGRLGHGNSSDLFTPQPIRALQGIKIRLVTCGDSHCLAVTTNGEVQRSVAYLKHMLIYLIYIWSSLRAIFDSFIFFLSIILVVQAIVIL